MAAIEIDIKDVENFEKNLNDLASKMSPEILNQYAHDIAKHVVYTVENRYKESGKNYKGEDWLGIKLSSYIRRGNTRTKSGKVSAHGKRVAKYASMMGGDERLPVTQARPLLTTTAAQTKLKFSFSGNKTEYTIVVSPSRKKADGTYIAEYHKGGGKVMPNRSAHFLSPEDKTEILAMGVRALDKMEKALMK
jgi:ribosomal protein S16